MLLAGLPYQRLGVGSARPRTASTAMSLSVPLLGQEDEDGAELLEMFNPLDRAESKKSDRTPLSSEYGLDPCRRRRSHSCPRRRLIRSSIRCASSTT